MRWSRFCVFGLVLLLSLLVGRELAADPAAQARFHDELARKEYRAGRFENALREFFLEQRVSPNPRIAFNIALCFQDLKRPEEAFHYFSQYLASDDADPERRSYAERRVEALKAKLARVRVESVPEGASIYVDRKELGSYGQTPAVVAVSPGEHQIFVELEGYRPASGTVTAKAGEEVSVTLSGPRILGRLRVTSPVAGKIVVRGARGDSVASGPSPLEAEAPPGAYDVSLIAPGHLPWHGVARIEADQAVDILATPQRAPASSGDITVTSNVPGALVELNGQPAGFAPTVLSGIPIGRQRLLLKAPSMLSWTGSVNVRPDERSWLTVSLAERASVRRSPATWIVGGVGVGALAVGGVFGILAAQAHSDFENAPAGTDRTVLRERGLTLNTITTATLAGAAAALATAVVLYFATAETSGAQSSASVSRSRR